MTDTTPSEMDDTRALLELESMAHNDVRLPADAHVIGEPVSVTEILRYPALPRVGLLAKCRRSDRVYEVNLADVVFPPGSAGASFIARYREWLGLPPFAEVAPEAARPHKVEGDDIVVGRPIDLVVLACKSNALRCRLLGSAREVTLRTAVRDEIPGAIITVTPKKQWTHARHPYLSGDVAAVRIDASVLGLVPLALHREDHPPDQAAQSDGDRGRRAVYRMEQPYPSTSRDACIDAGEYALVDELLHKVLAVEIRCLEA
ncbi:MAG TPA: hypothetical protein VJR89_24955, partial [Polyangiales bacterium]|nr:hypothetical protein [Polyangiales bacterium]